MLGTVGRAGLGPAGFNTIGWREKVVKEETAWAESRTLQPQGSNLNFRAAQELD